MVSFLYTTKDGDMLDEICWKHYGMQAGAVELVLEANPHKKDLLKPVLEQGLVITLPDIVLESKDTTVDLWN